MKRRPKEVSTALTEMRTVLSRAKTARDRIVNKSEFVRDDENGGFKYVYDRDWQSMAHDLDSVIAQLEKWAK